VRPPLVDDDDDGEVAEAEGTVVGAPGEPVAESGSVVTTMPKGFSEHTTGCMPKHTSK
jgi:hypothetical protein